MSPTPDTAAGAGTRGVAALWPYAVVLAVGMFVLLPKLGQYGFWDPWEPKYAESAREMSERGSYIVPYYRDEVRLTKPILAYWGILAGTAVFGVNELGARIGGVCMALATMAGVYYAVSRLRGRRAGLIAALVLGTAPQFYFIARQAMPDPYLMASLGLSLLFFCLALFQPDRRRNLHFNLCYACISIAVLAKGPVIIGAVFLATLALWTGLLIDPREVWLPERRGATLRFVGAFIPAAALLAGLAFTAYLFGTSPVWWGFSTERREDTALVREQIAYTFQRFRLAEVLLVLVAGLCAAWILQLLRRSRAPGAKPPVGTAAVAGLAGLGALASLASAPGIRIFASAVFGGATCVWFAVTETTRFFSQPWLWTTLAPYVKEVGRQLLRFLVVFLVVAGPWHVGIFIEQGHGYITDFLIKHNLNRANEIINRTGDADFYIGVLMYGLFPWCGFLPVAFAWLVDWRRDALRRYGPEIVLLLATLVTFTAFSSAATKFAHYLSPILVPACVLIALAIDRTLEEPHSPASRLAWVVAGALFLLPALDLKHEGLTHLVETFTMKRWVPDALAPGRYLEGLAIAAGVALFASIIVRSRWLVAALVASAALMANHYTSTFIPALSVHKTMKNLTDTWKRSAPNGEPPLCFFGDTKHGIFYYTDSKVRRIGTRESFEEFMDPAKHVFCIVERDSFKTLQRNHRMRYSASDLYVADDSHFDYVLIQNWQSRQTAP